MNKIIANKQANEGDERYFASTPIQWGFSFQIKEVVR